MGGDPAETILALIDHNLRCTMSKGLRGGMEQKYGYMAAIDLTPNRCQAPTFLLYLYKAKDPVGC
jgi:hypothetical protein